MSRTQLLHRSCNSRFPNSVSTGTRALPPGPPVITIDFQVGPRRAAPLSLGLVPHDDERARGTQPRAGIRGDGRRD